MERRPGSLDSEAPTPVLDERSAHPAAGPLDPFPFAGFRQADLDPDSLAPASLPPTDRSLLAQARQGSWNARLVLVGVGVNLFALGLALGIGLSRDGDPAPAPVQGSVLAPALPAERPPVAPADKPPLAAPEGPEEGAPAAVADVPPGDGAVDPGLATVPQIPDPPPAPARASASSPPAPESEEEARPATWGPFEARPVPAPVQDRRKLLPLGRRR